MPRPIRVRLSPRFLAALGLALAILGVARLRAPAREVLAGPVPAQVIAVLDGDTVVVRAHIWLGQEVAIRVRLAGVDAPELHGRCDVERAAARLARDFLRDRLAAGGARLSDIHYGKYAGRVVARLSDMHGADLSAALIDAGLARAYDGGARASWCSMQGARR